MCRSTPIFPLSRHENEDEEIFIGYIHKSDMIGKDPTLTINDSIRPILEIASTSSVDYIFAEMLRAHDHIGVVYDELGTWLGVITMEDILEAILGQEILDETDKVIDMRSYAKLVWSNKRAQKKSKINQTATFHPTDS